MAQKIRSLNLRLPGTIQEGAAHDESLASAKVTMLMKNSKLALKVAVETIELRASVAEETPTVGKRAPLPL